MEAISWVINLIYAASLNYRISETYLNKNYFEKQIWICFRWAKTYQDSARRDIQHVRLHLHFMGGKNSISA